MTTTTYKPREAALVSDRRQRYIMGFPVWEALPAPEVPYDLSDPFILVHEATIVNSQIAQVDTEHPHRGFDNLWYILSGSTSTGHSTGPDGAFERVDLPEGSLLYLRAGRGVRHAEGVGADQIRDGFYSDEVRAVLFWVNLARKDKANQPEASVLLRQNIPSSREGDAIVRVLVGDGSPIKLGTPAVILDAALEQGGSTTHRVPEDFQGFAYLLDGKASFGANRLRAEAGQLVLLGPGESLTVEEAAPGTRYLLMAGRPYGERPRFNGPFVD